MMKSDKTLFAVLLVMMILPQLGWSQDHETHDHDNISVVTPKRDLWKPFNKFPNSEIRIQSENNTESIPPFINILNGVSFYSTNSVCSSEKVILLKLINTNTFPVLVTWQMSPESDKVIVEIPASSDFEGSCADIGKDKNKDKLIMKMPEKSEIKKVEQYVIKHLSVTQK